MPNRKSYENGRKYRKEWEKEFIWLSKVPGLGEFARCNVCKIDLKPHKPVLAKHQDSDGHRSRICTKKTSLPFQPLDSVPVKKAEIMLAAQVACHNSLRSIDHLSEIVKDNGKGSVLEKIRIHRSKCGIVVKNIISAGLKSELKKAMMGKKFSLLIDESTDISSAKLLAVCVR